MMNQIFSIMSLTKFGLTLAPLVHTNFAISLFLLNNPLLVFWGLNPGPLIILLAILIYVLGIPLLVFLCLKFLHLEESSPLLVFLSLMFLHK